MSKPIHPIQAQMLDLATTRDITSMRLVDLAHLLGVKHLQQVKHHREQLVKQGLLERSLTKAVTSTKLPDGVELLKIPILEFKQ